MLENGRLIAAAVVRPAAASTELLDKGWEL
jgi:hypothetical protein